MKRSNLFLMVAAILGFCLTILNNAVADTGMSESEKMMLYETSKKNPMTAALLSCCITSTGHLYADNWARGLAFTAARLALGVIAITGIETKTVDHGWYTEETAEPTPQYYIGYYGIWIVAVWEMIDAYNQVELYNQRLRARIYKTEGNKGIGLKLAPDRDGARLMLSYNF